MNSLLDLARGFFCLRTTMWDLVSASTIALSKCGLVSGQNFPLCLRTSGSNHHSVCQVLANYCLKHVSLSVVFATRAILCLQQVSISVDPRLVPFGVVPTTCTLTCSLCHSKLATAILHSLCNMCHVCEQSLPSCIFLLCRSVLRSQLVPFSVWSLMCSFQCV